LTGIAVGASRRRQRLHGCRGFDAARSGVTLAGVVNQPLGGSGAEQDAGVEGLG